ncbi:unnamed protein product [Nesidiocoris tenuis]|uniref:Uncharacterized protein n=1 Tax=Nesidiocoris tenuis TaxID=355587 RepID=A0A6H5HP31_9HEMI|nr:unnamed protein product [Nesidiocoris tenuis]
MVEEKAIACSFVQGTRSCSNVKVYNTVPTDIKASLQGYNSDGTLINADFEVLAEQFEELTRLMVKFQTQWRF